MAERISRRLFLRDTTTVTAGLASASAATATATASRAADAPGPAGEATFASHWSETPDRVWVGREYWANPLQDWRIAGGRLECVNAAAERSVHLLTRDLAERPGNLVMSVRAGRVEGGALGSGKGSLGFRVGIRGPLGDHRNNLLATTGLSAGITARGDLFVGDVRSGGTVRVEPGESVELTLAIEPDGDHYRATLTARDPASGKVLGEARRGGLAADRLAGNLALVANFGGGPPAMAKKAAARKAAARSQAVAPGAGADRFWFADWRVSGSRVQAHDDRGFGPILFAQYTLSGGVLKLSAQMPPLGARDARTVRLELQQPDGSWRQAGEAAIDPETRVAAFRIARWDDTKDTPYRLVYAHRGGQGDEHYWTGTIRRDPVDKPVITVADVSCNTHAAFPNAEYVDLMARLEPDLLAFVGDQFYENSGGFGVVRAPLETAILDYLRKWYLHGWTWRELMRDRPSIALPDDHDVYQGNIWGEAGAPEHGTQEMGGYQMHPAWVNVVIRTQTAHHPDPPDPSPIKQGIHVFYGPLTYGRISFAMVADRQFKSGPQGKVPPTGSRGDHVVDPNFDPKTADRPGLELLGRRQEEFLRDWADDWRGAELKAVISQTIFTAMATTHGANRERLRADYDANGWPQTPRNNALRAIRQALAVHIAGDQHLPAVVQYGIDRHRDAAVAFAGPAVNVGYPRWWEPEQPGQNRAPGAPEILGDFLDHFGNPMTVLAVANGAERSRPGVLDGLRDRASGLGLVRFDKRKRSVTFECWPFLADVTEPGTQFPGWPVTVDVLETAARHATAHLPRLEVRGTDQPVVQVIAEPSGEVVYTWRAAGRTFRPHVFAEGAYTVRVSDPETGRHKELKGLAALRDNDRTLEVILE